MQYRIYLIGVGNCIRAAESFGATDDQEATRIAMALYGSWSTSFQSVELRRGAEVVMRQRSDTVMATELQELIDGRQESIAQLEEIMERSFECVRQSRQLLDTLRTFPRERGAKEH